MRCAGRDYGGHDSRFTGNVIYHGHNDGQNCVNTWPFLAGHGAVWEGNKCVLPLSNNLAGSIAGCDCPGPAAVVPWNASDPTSRPPTECGVSFGNNEYFTHNGSATYNRCGDFDTMWKAKNEPDSNISSLPSDEELLGKRADFRSSCDLAVKSARPVFLIGAVGGAGWAREKLDM